MDIKEAIEQLKIRRKHFEDFLDSQIWVETDMKAVEVLLSELDKKDKIINEMADSMYLLDSMSEYGNSRKDIIDYFTKKCNGGKNE